jgi:hypothetical protein
MGNRTTVTHQLKPRCAPSSGVGQARWSATARLVRSSCQPLVCFAEFGSCGSRRRRLRRRRCRATGGTSGAVLARPCTHARERRLHPCQPSRRRRVDVEGSCERLDRGLIRSGRDALGRWLARRRREAPLRGYERQRGSRGRGRRGPVGAVGSGDEDAWAQPSRPITRSSSRPGRSRRRAGDAR